MMWALLVTLYKQKANFLDDSKKNYQESREKKKRKKIN